VSVRVLLPPCCGNITGRGSVLFWMPCDHQRSLYVPVTYAKQNRVR
jgi:hypothetical protein